MLFNSIAFTIALLIIRICKTGTYAYAFFIWNLFLALIPLLLSRKLKNHSKIGVASITIMSFWLLFFPNAPYIITDLFHFRKREPVPQWYDLVLVTSAAWNGLLLGIVSLMQVEQFLSTHIKGIWLRITVFSFMLLCGYGIFIGRFLRYNSWNIVTKPGKLVHTTAHHVFQPQANIKVWAFTFLFAAMFGLAYYTLQAIRMAKQSFAIPST